MATVMLFVQGHYMAFGIVEMEVSTEKGHLLTVMDVQVNSTPNRNCVITHVSFKSTILLLLSS